MCLEIEMVADVKQKMPWQFQLQSNQDRATLAKRERTKLIGLGKRGMYVSLVLLLKRNREQRKEQSFKVT